MLYGLEVEMLEEIPEKKKQMSDVKAGKVYSADSIEAERKRGLENSET